MASRRASWLIPTTLPCWFSVGVVGPGLSLAAGPVGRAAPRRWSSPALQLPTSSGPSGCWAGSPLDALDDFQVAKVFVACHTIDSSGGELFHEIWNELRPEELTIARPRLAGLVIEWLRPRDQAAAREWGSFRSSSAPWDGWKPRPTPGPPAMRRAPDAASAPDRLAFS